MKKARVRLSLDEQPLKRLGAGWHQLPYLDAAACGAVLLVALSAFLRPSPAFIIVAALAGAVTGAAFAWCMKRREARNEEQS